MFGNRTNIIHTDSNQLTQIMKINVSKEYAVKVISDKFGISLGNIVVFGDDFNDLGLFKDDMIRQKYISPYFPMELK